MTEPLDDLAPWARAWLFEAALPLWWERGADRVHGGFHELLDQAGEPMRAAKRLRVQARQIFVYAEAGRLGWRGPWREAVAHGLAFLLDAYQRDDGLFRTRVGVPGVEGSDAVDLYDQAFVLLALASARRVGHEPELALDRARALLDVLRSRLAHPLGGFEEDASRRLRLRSNPHMHMLEALLAWTGLGDEPCFADTAREIVGLAVARMIDPATGAIGEYFDRGWGFADGTEGSLREPGHQFEWAYLLGEADRLLGTGTAAEQRRLLAFGEERGVHDGRAIFSVDAEGRIVDGSSRLWAQTERLRAMSSMGDEPARSKALRESAACLRALLDRPVQGLWTDRVMADGTWLDEPAPASSFYHVMTALAPLVRER